MVAAPGMAVDVGFTKRQEVCVICDPSKKLVCPPSCPKGQRCEFIYPTNCNECPQALCLVDDSIPATPPPSSGSSTNVGAIAGGVVGGLAVIAIITYLVW